MFLLASYPDQRMIEANGADCGKKSQSNESRAVAATQTPAAEQTDQRAGERPGFLLTLNCEA